MQYQVTYLLPLSFSFACVKSVRDCILISARRARSRRPAVHPASHLPQATCRLGRRVSSPHTVGSPASSQYYVGVWPLLLRAVAESIFCGSLGTTDPFNLRVGAAFAFFSLAFGVACLISLRFAPSGVTAESSCISL